MYLLAVHLAYNVTLFVGVYGEVTLFPPVDAVYHPSNVYPGFVGVDNVTLFGVYCAVNVPLPSPNVYVVPSIFPFPDNVHAVNVFVCVTVDVVPSLFKVTSYPFGAVGFGTVVVEV